VRAAMTARYTRISTTVIVVTTSRLLGPEHRSQEIPEKRDAHGEAENVFPSHRALPQTLSQRRV
jgi:hypothetical protein